MLMARAMFAGFLVWLDEPAESSLPHFVGAQFSWNGLSLTCARTPVADNAKVQATATAMIGTFIVSPSPDCFWMSAIWRAAKHSNTPVNPLSVPITLNVWRCRNARTLYYAFLLIAESFAAQHDDWLNSYSCRGPVAPVSSNSYFVAILRTMWVITSVPNIALSMETRSSLPCTPPRSFGVSLNGMKP